MSSRSIRLSVVLGLVLLFAIPTYAPAQQVDPQHRFRTRRTPHFAVHYHQGADDLAATLARVAEATWRQIADRSGARLPAMTHVVLSDQTEAANGFATPLPRNTIVLYVAAPAPTDLLGSGDWLRTVFVHEFAHIVHLDRAGGWARVARAVSGRAPWTFPNLLLPTWQIEGLATWAESRVPGSDAHGRLHAGDFLAITREAARAGAFAPIDRVGGGLTDWPGGLAPYAYGAAFHAWLADSRGADTLDALAEATARSLPWLGTRAFDRVYGQSIETLWREYASAAVTDARAAGAPAPQPARRLTTDGFQASAPRYLPRACADCADAVVYTRRTRHDRPGLYVVQLDTLETRRLTTRYPGGTTAVAANGRIYFDQPERRRNAGLYADLYVHDPDASHTQPLTSGARLMDPDVSPVSEILAAVQHRHPGQRDLVLVKPGTGSASTEVITLVAEPETQFNTPRWSPDGRTLVVARQRGDAPADLVLVDVDDGRVRALTTTPDMRWATPAWRPDSQAIVAAGAAGDAPPDLYEITLDDGQMRRITEHPGGATWPDVAPDGRTIVYVGYSIEGFDLYEIPYDVARPGARSLEASVSRSAEAPTSRSPGASTAPSPEASISRSPEPSTARPPEASTARNPEASIPQSPEASSARSPEASASGDLPSSPYRPWSTLLPTSWTPVLTTSREQVRAGIAAGGRDVLGYHAWTASLAWPVVDRMETNAAGGDADWDVSYVYGRWRPHVWGALRRETTFVPVEQTDESRAPATIVERLTEIGVQVPILHLRSAQTVQVSIVRATDRVTIDETTGQRDRSGVRAAWRYANAQAPAYGVSLERGISVGVATEFVAPALGASARGGTVTVDARAYLPGLRRHDVVAIRASRAATWGNGAIGRLFVLGGGDASPGPGTIGSDGLHLLRGFPASTFVGRQAAIVNLDYRFPIARPQRGLGAWPFFLHTVHGAIVADAGHAWNATFDAHAVKLSVGAELSANVVLGYGLPLTMTAGAARGWDRAHQAAGGTTAYVRIGYAF